MLSLPLRAREFGLLLIIVLEIFQDFLLDLLEGESCLSNQITYQYGLCLQLNLPKDRFLPAAKQHLARPLPPFVILYVKVLVDSQWINYHSV